MSGVGRPWKWPAGAAVHGHDELRTRSPMPACGGLGPQTVSNGPDSLRGKEAQGEPNLAPDRTGQQPHGHTVATPELLPEQRRRRWSVRGNHLWRQL